MRPLIIDTDPGVDDAFAIALAAASPEVDLLAVTTVFGNVALEATTANALRVLALCGRPDVPVAAGASRPLVHPHPRRARYAHGADGLSGQGHTLPESTATVDTRDAVRLMADVLRTAAEPVTIAAIGPLTNLALLLAAHPAVKAKIDRLVIMGGGLACGNVTASAEFNVWSDPESARRVLVEEDLPTVLVPMDLTMRCAVDQEWLRRLAAANEVGATLVGLTSYYQEHYRRTLGWEGLVLHDATALAEAIQPGILDTTALAVEVECSAGPARGATIADQRRGDVSERAGTDTSRTVDVALDTDVTALGEFVLSRLRTLGR